MSRNLFRQSTSHVVLSLGRTALQITAQFAPVPAMAPLAEVICGLMVLCQNVSQNRHAAHQLQERCHRLALAVFDRAVANDNVAAAIAGVLQCLQGIQLRMQQWTSYGNFKAFVRQDEIAKDIANCHDQLSDCFTAFQLASQLEIHNWQAQFQQDKQRDYNELLGHLTNLENSQSLIHEAMQAQREDTRQLMSMMQTLMGQNITTAEHQHSGLPSNLFDLQTHSQELLPDFHLRRGEVIRLGQFPVSGTPAMDIYEGLYLRRQKVAIKVVRAVNSDERSLRRFKREVEIWKELWKRDQGKHVLPFFGFCQEDGPFPYMVSPWMHNGNALTYVKQQDTSIDYVKLVQGIAQGIHVLHSMSPAPVVHGDIKANNVMVDGLGNPLIADFGLSKIVEDVTGIPFSQSRGVSDSYRWFAPEVCIGQGVLSLGSDVYAYGMTVLELFTHAQPFSEIKHTTEVVIRTSQGVQPTRPREQAVINRGLNDALWNLLCHCWAKDPLRRPRIDEILAMF
ncbi:TKL/TKL-ccin protein kinase [Mycena indigotica]|uniref:TKL/TKL-ccin protein kinase n=1 Tax=Mycena indigotica TaxID=2126181 RepID=A0A8H6SMB4_9AGAR|nr:TKL/TKL-ccin protein kinase [Mycena indigotica]KAF7301447.1 TKL/TKL-ccin protein kinase [Mycena indigotica]